MKNEYVNLQCLFHGDDLKRIINRYGHQVVDCFGTILSENKNNEALSTKIIENDGKELVSLKLPANKGEHVREICANALEGMLNRHRLEHRFSALETLGFDRIELFQGHGTKDIADSAKTLMTALNAQFYFSYSALFLVEDNTINRIYDQYSVAKGQQINDTFWEDEIVATYVSNQQKNLYYFPNQKTDVPLEQFYPKDAPKNLIAIPLIADKKTIAVMILKDSHLVVFTESDRHLLKNYLLAFGLLAFEYHKKIEIEQMQNASQMMERYLDRKVFQHLKNTAKEGAKSLKKDVVICFAAINNFNHLIHALPPKKLLQLMNYHFGLMNEITDKLHGTIDKVIGHVFMVFWNHPDEQTDAATLAVKAGIKMLKSALEERLLWQKSGIHDFSLKIGINSGPVVVGNHGSKEFKNYTAIGDTINTAQRLMSVSTPGQMMVNEHLIPLLPPELTPLKKISDIKLKGKARPITAFAFDHTLDKSDE